jgi:hypothetical protein
MLKAKVAEWILSLTTTHDRATSTAGDLIEESSTRGALWFWSSLLRTTLALIWRAWTDAPLQMTGFAVRACLIQFGVFLVAAVGVGIGSVFGWFSLSPQSLATTAEAATFVVVALAVMAGDFQVGRWIARRAPQRELAACIGYIVVRTVFLQILEAISPTAPPPVTLMGQLAILDQLLRAGELLCLFAGIRRVRRQSMAARSISSQ